MNRIFYWIAAILLFINALAGFVLLAIFLSLGPAGPAALAAIFHSSKPSSLFKFLPVFSPFAALFSLSIFILPLLIFFSIFFIIWGILYLSFACGKREMNIFSNLSLIFLVLLLFSHVLSFLFLHILHPDLFTEQIARQTSGMVGIVIIGYYLIYYFSFLVVSSILGIILTIIGFIKGKKSNLRTALPKNIISD